MGMFSSLRKYLNLRTMHESPCSGTVSVSLVRVPRNRTVSVRFGTEEAVLHVKNPIAEFDVFPNAARTLSIDAQEYEICTRTLELESTTVKIELTKHKLKIQPTDFTRVKLLSAGRSKVYLVRYNPSGRTYACKVRKKSEKNHALVNEKNHLVKLKSPFLIPLLASFQSENELFLVFPHYKRDLFSLLEGGKLPERVARVYFCEVLAGLEHVHRMGIIYKDVKPENILLDGGNHVVLCDFDASVNAESAGMANFQGTLEYMPPEVFTTGKYGPSYDFYTLGVLLYEMIVGETPFQRGENEDEDDLVNKILYEEAEYPGVSAEIQVLISGLMHRDPGKRLGSAGVRGSAWLQGMDWEKVLGKAYSIDVPAPESEEKPVEDESVEEDSCRNTVHGFTWMAEEWDEE
ncbi:ribosomal protein S6 kinase beta [Nematocida major]|uniref:ribosomal protein S6 kinase beta n=1 Tax=Nematocida major TaxID=1912982 RepID=UPI0020087D2A|nr:ribosomal protein S6 kinase beta [Nematocida major]KAH9387172.1 ribosomal protein S6 kinase beta [Nematocida major]